MGFQEFKLKQNNEFLKVLCNNQKNENIPHYKVIFDNRNNVNAVNPHIKIIWDNKAAKKIEIWVNGKLFKNK